MPNNIHEKKPFQNWKKIYQNKRRDTWNTRQTEKFHHYYFTREVSMPTKDKPLVTIFKEDIKPLLQRQQHILLRIHQYKIHIVHMPRPDLYISNWLSRQNHAKTKVKKFRYKLAIIQWPWRAAEEWVQPNFYTMHYNKYSWITWAAKRRECWQESQYTWYKFTCDSAGTVTEL